MRHFIRPTGRGRFQAGDTLVEVLICILLVSTILTGAYVTTNSSSQAVRDSQEHAEALKLLQGQVEQVKSSANQPSPNVFDQPVATPFCMTNGAVVQAVGPTQDQCIVDGSGAPTTEQPAYNLSMTVDTCAPYAAPPGTTCHLLSARATWDSISSNTTAVETLTTRVYE